jgi:uncharacterized protein YqhQ
MKKIGIQYIVFSAIIYFLISSLLTSIIKNFDDRIISRIIESIIFATLFGYIMGYRIKNVQKKIIRSGRLFREKVVSL